MHHLQNLYDQYIATGPSEGKIKTATSFLIHACNALNTSSAEAVTEDMFEEIPAALTFYFKTTPHRAIQDKSILAEMIGRYGPRDGWQKTLRILLNDDDENLRQFALKALEYSACSYMEEILPIVDYYRKNDDLLMKHIAARVAVAMLCSQRKETMKKIIKQWAHSGDAVFISEILQYLITMDKRNLQNTQNGNYREFIHWIREDLNVDGL